MLNMFPMLLTYNLIGPIIIRVVLGVVFLHFGYKRIATKDKRLVVYGMVKSVIGILFIAGLATQLAGIFASVILIVQLVHKIRTKAFLSDGINYYILLLAMALSLIFSGAGAFALDWPL